MGPLVAIVGRPNVGKSRLFNRMASKRKSIVLDLSGTTRDTIYETVEWNRMKFDIVDTGGLTEGRNNIHFRINKRVESVVGESAVVLLVCDYKTGVQPYDGEIARWLRKTGKPFFVVVNKIDRPEDPSAVADFYQLGGREVFGISAEHGYGVDQVMDAVVEHMKVHGADRSPGPEEDAKRLRLVFTGKPNVGKSSMVNYITGREFMIVDDRPGTTRDAVELKVELGGKPMMLIDTAGLRKGRNDTTVEAIAALRAKDAVQRADISILVLDASQGVTGYDKRIMSLIQERGKGSVIALNKWDVIPREHRKALLKQLSDMLGFVPYVPVVPTSALTGEGIQKLVRETIAVARAYEHRIPTPALNRFFRAVLDEHQPVSSNGKVIKLYYLVQISVRPPVFVIFTNKKEGIRENYSRFIVNRIRDVFGFQGVPIKLIFRGKSSC